MLEDKIKAAIIEALKGIPELNGCLPGDVVITDPASNPGQGLTFHVVFDIPLPINFAGA